MNLFAIEKVASFSRVNEGVHVSENRIVDCPACSESGCTPSFRLKDRIRPKSVEEFLLFHCRRCGTVFQDIESVKNRLDEFYPRGYWWSGSGKLSAMEGLYREWMVRLDQLRFIRSAFPRPEGLRLLDIGCGNGLLVRLALQKGFEAYGLDSSRQAVEIAHRAGLTSIRCGSEDDLLQEGESFDVVTMFHSLEHFPDPVGYLQKSKALLTPGGSFVIQVPNAGSVQARVLGKSWYGFDCPRHLVNFNPQALSILLQRIGFEIRAIEFFSLRDNAAALVSSLFPWLDPIGEKVKLIDRTGLSSSWLLGAKEFCYLALVLLAQPLAWLEALVGRGATMKVHAVKRRD